MADLSRRSFVKWSAALAERPFAAYAVAAWTIFACAVAGVAVARYAFYAASVI